MGEGEENIYVLGGLLLQPIRCCDSRKGVGEKYTNICVSKVCGKQNKTKIRKRKEEKYRQM